MKIYAIQTGEYSSRWVQAVAFTDKATAEVLAKRLDPEDGTVREIEIDPTIDRLQDFLDNVPIWELDFDNEGNCLEADDDAWDIPSWFAYIGKPVRMGNKTNGYWGYRTCVIARTREGAIKSGWEQVMQAKAKGEVE